jgi:hypothetical protein
MANKRDYLRQMDGLEINQVEDGFIIYHAQRDRVHFLNHTAVFVLELCNGKHTADEIRDIVWGIYRLKETPETTIHDTLDRLMEEELVRS